MNAETPQFAFVGVLYAKCEAQAKIDQVLGESVTVDSSPTSKTGAMSIDPSITYWQLTWRGEQEQDWAAYSNVWHALMQSLFETTEVSTREVIGLTNFFTTNQRVETSDCVHSLKGTEKTVRQSTAVGADRLRLFRLVHDEDRPGQRVYVIDTCETNDIQNSAADLLLGGTAELLNLDLLGHKVAWLRHQVRFPERDEASLDTFTAAIREAVHEVRSASRFREIESTLASLADTCQTSQVAFQTYYQNQTELELQNSILERFRCRDELKPLVELFRNLCDAMQCELKPKVRALEMQLQSAAAFESHVNARISAIKGRITDRLANVLALLGCAVGFAEIIDSDIVREILQLMGDPKPSASLVAIGRMIGVSLAAIASWLLIRLTGILTNWTHD